jgi:hypothetical protein
VRAVEFAGALADPQEVRRGVVRRAGARIDARHRTLVVHQQTFMARVEVDSAKLVEVGAGGLHELDGTVDVVGEALVRLVGGVLGEALVPAVHLAQIGEPALRERADQIDRRGGRVVALEQPCRVGPARAFGEVEAVDDVAAVCGQGHVAARLGVARAGLRELPRHAAHLHDRHGGAVGQHDRHLQDRLDAVADLLGSRPGERLGAVAALQHERATGCRLPQLVAQVVDLAREDQGRQRGDLGGDCRNSVRVVPRGLLFDGQGPPVVECVKLLEHPLSLSAPAPSPGPRDGPRRLSPRAMPAVGS